MWDGRRGDGIAAGDYIAGIVGVHPAGWGEEEGKGEKEDGGSKSFLEQGGICFERFMRWPEGRDWGSFFYPKFPNLVLGKRLASTLKVRERRG